MNKVLLIAFASIFFLGSCGLFKKSTKETATAEKRMETIQSIETNQFDFDWLSMKSSADIKGNINLPFNRLNFNIRMKKDSLIWVSVSAILNIEGARFLISPDSIKVIDKLKGTYTAKPFNFIQTYIPVPVSFNDLQNLLVGNPFLIDPENGKLMHNGDNLELVSHLQHLINRTSFDPKTHKLTAVEMEDGRVKQHSKLSYESFQTVNEQLFPTERSLELVSKDSLKIDFNCAKIKVNQPFGFPFKSHKYEKL